MASILKPVRGIRDAQERAGITPTNHSRHNILAIKEQSRLNALQKLQQQDDALAAAQQQPRAQIRRTTSGVAGAPAGGPRGISTSVPGGASGRPAIARSISCGGALAGRPGSSSGDGSRRNFLEENKAAAAAASKPVKAESRQENGAYMQKTEYGQVPAYLLQRKMELARQEEAMLAAKQAAQIPPGGFA